EGAVLPGLLRLRAREDLVPAGEFRPDPLGIDRDWIALYRLVARIGLLHDPLGLGVEEDGKASRLVRRLHPPVEIADLRLIARAFGPGGDHPPPLLDLERDRHARVMLLQQAGAKCREGPDPGLDAVLVPPDAGDREGSRPAVVADEAHRRLAPVLLVACTPAHHRLEH